MQPEDLQEVQRLSEAVGQIRSELAKVIVGQDQVLEQLLVAMFARGHCLLVGVPGLAKTLMIRSLADALSLDFSRIQFTPDLMPSDITGTEVIQEDKLTGERRFRFLRGPVFAHIVLADEINRTPPKTQAALLEAMQEHQVTVGGEKHALPAPFFVLATQNPIEQEGTYPLPEAQLDRFMFQVWVDYPDEDEELDIVKRTTSDLEVQITPTLDAGQIADLARVVRRVPVADHIARYALQLARRTRPQQPGAPDFVRQCVMWGAGPRASQYLVLGAKARAILQGRLCVAHEDIRAVAPPVLRHRIKTNFNADAEGITPDDIVRQLIELIPENGEDPADREHVPPKFLDPQTLASLRELHLRAQHIVEGFVAGLHRSPYHGFSIEFAEHREYAPGDDLRYVDWKAFGRTDKFYLKQFEDETNLIGYLVLDVSQSMTYRSADAPLSKLEYAQCVAVALAWLILHQQDSAGLVTIDDQIRSLVRPSGNASQLKQFLQVMENSSATAKTATGPIFHELAERFTKRGVVVIISDFFDKLESMLAGLRHFRHRRHDVILLQVLDPAELEFPFDQPTMFKGLEAFPEILADPRSLRRAYLQEMQGFLRELQGACRRMGMDYCQLLTNQSLDRALAPYLAARMNRIK